MTIRISAVICTYKRYDLLDKAVASLRAQNLPADAFDIWVVDNSPAGLPRDEAAQRYKDINFIAVDETGLSNARNTAAHLSKAPFIAFLDDDAVAKSDWLEKLLVIFDHDEKIGVVGGTIIPNYEAPRPVWLHDNLLGYLSVVNFGGDARQVDEKGNVFIAGANIAFNRTALLQVGGFNTSFGRKGGDANLLSGEESAVIEAMLRHGLQVWYAPAASVTHFIPADRLKRGWFRRRAAWASVTNQMMEDLSVGKAIGLWKVIIEYMKHVPPEHQQFMGLLWDVDDPGLFYAQIMATRAFQRLLLAQGTLPAGMLQ